MQQSFNRNSFLSYFRTMWLMYLMVAANSITDIRRTRSSSTERVFQILVKKPRRSRCSALRRKRGSLKSCVRLQRRGKYGGIQLECSTGVSTSRTCLKVLDQNGLTLVTRLLSMTTGQHIVTSDQKFWTSFAANRL